MKCFSVTAQCPNPAVFLLTDPLSLGTSADVFEMCTFLNSCSSLVSPPPLKVLSLSVHLVSGLGLLDSELGSVRAL